MSQRNQDAQPELGLVGFFEDDAELRDKLVVASCPAGSSIVRCNRCSSVDELPRQPERLKRTWQCPAKQDRVDREVLCPLLQFVRLGHADRRARTMPSSEGILRRIRRISRCPLSNL